MAAPWFRKTLRMKKHFLQALWKSDLSYRQCSTLKYSIKDLLHRDVSNNSKKTVVAEVNLVSISTGHGGGFASIMIRPMWIRSRWGFNSASTSFLFFSHSQSGQHIPVSLLLSSKFPNFNGGF